MVTTTPQTWTTTTTSRRRRKKNHRLTKNKILNKSYLTSVTRGSVISGSNSSVVWVIPTLARTRTTFLTQTRSSAPQADPLGPSPWASPACPCLS